MTLSIAAAALIAINLVIFVLFTPAGERGDTKPTGAAQNWQALRVQWEYSHAVNAAVTFLAFCCAALASLEAARVYCSSCSAPPGSAIQEGTLRRGGQLKGFGLGDEVMADGSALQPADALVRKSNASQPNEIRRVPQGARGPAGRGDRASPPCRARRRAAPRPAARRRGQGRLSIHRRSEQRGRRQSCRLRRSCSAIRTRCSSTTGCTAPSARGLARCAPRC